MDVESVTESINVDNAKVVDKTMSDLDTIAANILPSDEEKNQTVENLDLSSVGEILEESLNKTSELSERITNAVKNDIWHLLKDGDDDIRSVEHERLKLMTDELFEKDENDFSTFLHNIRSKLREKRYKDIKKLKERIALGEPIGSALDFFAGRPQKSTVAGVELRLSKEDLMSTEIDNIKIGLRQLIMFINWASQKYKLKKKKTVKNKEIFQLTGKKLKKYKNKINIQSWNKIFTSVKKLPKVQDQIYFLTPHESNAPKNCFENFPSGSIYLGTANTLGMNGFGTYLFPNGAVYVGQMKDNMFHGFGHMIYPNKSLVEGLWYKGRIINPKVTFADGVNFKPEKWDYLVFPDRRYVSERLRGMLPDINPQLTNDHPARKIPPKCFDNGEGFYHFNQRAIYHPINGKFLRIPSVKEANWIVRNCRYSTNNIPVPFLERMYPAQYGKLRNKFEDFDTKWFKDVFPEIPLKKLKKIKQEIIQDFDGGINMSYEELLKLSVKPLRDINCERRYFKNKKQFVNFKKLITQMKNLLYPEKYEIDECKKQSETMEYKGKKKFRIKRFIRTLKRINKFICGEEDLEWSNETEDLINYYSKYLRILKDGFINNKINLDMFGNCVRERSDKIKKALSKYLQYYKDDITLEEEEEDPSDIGFMDSNQLKTQKAIAKKTPVLSMSTPSSEYFYTGSKIKFISAKRS